MIGQHSALLHHAPGAVHLRLAHHNGWAGTYRLEVLHSVKGARCVGVHVLVEGCHDPVYPVVVRISPLLKHFAHALGQRVHLFGSLLVLVGFAVGCIRNDDRLAGGLGIEHVHRRAFAVLELHAKVGHGHPFAIGLQNAL